MALEVVTQGWRECSGTPLYVQLQGSGGWSKQAESAGVRGKDSHPSPSQVHPLTHGREEMPLGLGLRGQSLSGWPGWAKSPRPPSTAFRDAGHYQEQPGGAALGYSAPAWPLLWRASLGTQFCVLIQFHQAS